MKVKRYVAKDMRQALKIIREELGPDAVILSNRRVTEGVEVQAAVDFNEAQLQSVATDPAGSPGANAARTARQQHQAADASPFESLLNQYAQSRHPNDRTDEELMTAMRSEIENLRLLLKDQMNLVNHEHWTLKNPAKAGILKRFEALNVSPAVARMLAEHASSRPTIDEGWRASLEYLQTKIPVLGESCITGGGVVALLGTTGVGKTTSLAKLAVRYALEYGRDNLALVTTDRYRIAAHEQLRTLGRIIDVPVSMVNEQNSLKQVLHTLRHKTLVLVDMPGLDLNHMERQEALQQLAESGRRVKRLLVLPCTAQETVLRRAYDALGGHTLDGCIMSKMDEAHGLGEVLSLIVEKQLPVAYITNGQSIPSDIEIADPCRLVDQLASQVSDGYATTGVHDCVDLPFISGAALQSGTSKLNQLRSAEI